MKFIDRILKAIIEWNAERSSPVVIADNGSTIKARDLKICRDIHEQTMKHDCSKDKHTPTVRGRLELLENELEELKLEKQEVDKFLRVEIGGHQSTQDYVKELREQLKSAREVIGFYGDKDNWQFRGAQFRAEDGNIGKSQHLGMCARKWLEDNPDD